jgi:hypothetical protein
MISRSDPDRLPEHVRALQLFANEHFDFDAARMLARSELEHRRRLEIDERQSKPAGRLVGWDRGQAG